MVTVCTSIYSGMYVSVHLIMPVSADIWTNFLLGKAMTS